MDKIKLIFDVEIMGNSYKQNQTGIYRVAYELFSRFYKNRDIDLVSANHNYTDSKDTKSKIREFLSENGLEADLICNSERKKFVPFRKEKPFRYLYKKLGLSDFMITYNETEIMDRQMIYHSVYYPINKSLNSFPNVKKIVTIHDLIPILYPQYNDNTKILKKTIKSLGKNNYAICVSENTRKDLLLHDPSLDPDKIFVSKLAASQEIFYPSVDEDKNISVKKKYNLPENYILSLSTLEPRKNIDHLIRTYIKTIITHNINDLYLVLVGSKGWQYDKIFEEYENAKDLKDKIIITGRIPDEDLAAVYSQANSFYYMSLYEGFGLPPLEAMQCGVPTVSSNTSSLPEVVGDGGILLDPRDEITLSETIFKFYTNEEFKKEYAKRGLERAKQFSWDKTIEEHISIYNTILQINTAL
ncbi:glycosyltransferase family 4 protein [Chryseobacterium chendengshani]|uniref:glycosyltransferase family 4 protein n=1 Tax=Chryseobacterium sp. LJ668 TaxID=2864040 RepID=UPI001C68C38A|nr:glycosyltransferase family 1 protein [Chryseobacterium sp. LJ668]MBW8524711.1 glycosyltransferase family 4 protein [Chryseobacterium sp. LJ668]QYK15110.1 glycosyltransferase family 4 protein [Chryseobacterium sp. LJ668]